MKVVGHKHKRMHQYTMNFRMDVKFISESSPGEGKFTGEDFTVIYSRRDVVREFVGVD